MVQLLIYLRWILFSLPVIYWPIFNRKLSPEDFFIITLTGVAGAWGVSIYLKRWVYPPGKKGARMRFKRCLRKYRMDEAQELALKEQDPYQTRMLQLAWRRFSQKRYAPGYLNGLFCWLDKLEPVQRERVAPGAYKEYGTALVKISIRNLYDWRTRRRDVDWSIADKIGYDLSRSELKRASKYGDKRAIDELNRRCGKGREDTKKSSIA